jgi:hypothetical protein
VYKSGVIAFLEWLTLTTKLPFVIDGNYWKEIIFDKTSTSITRTNVDSLFLSLAATGILEIQNSRDGIRWVLGQQAPTTPLTDTYVLLINIIFGVATYTLDNYWVGINLPSWYTGNSDTITFICNNLIEALACMLPTLTLLHLPVQLGYSLTSNPLSWS